MTSSTSSSCSCGYRPRESDKLYVEAHSVWHVICYNCGKEWVE